MYRAPGSHEDCGRSYRTSKAMRRHLREKGHGSSPDGQTPLRANAQFMARMRIRYPKMVLKPNGQVSSRSLGGLRGFRYHSGTKAAATALPAAATASPSNPFPVSSSIAAGNAPPPSSLRRITDSNVEVRGGGPTREGRPTLVPLAELEEAHVQMYGYPRAHGPQRATNVLPSPELTLLPLRGSSFALQSARS